MCLYEPGKFNGSYPFFPKENKNNQMQECLSCSHIKDEIFIFWETELENKTEPKPRTETENAEKRSKVQVFFQLIVTSIIYVCLGTFYFIFILHTSTPTLKSNWLNNFFVSKGILSFLMQIIVFKEFIQCNFRGFFQPKGAKSFHIWDSFDAFSNPRLKVGARDWTTDSSSP